MVMFRPLIRYADFKGRARRTEYWGFAVAQGLFYALLAGLGTASMGQTDSGQATAGVLIAFGLVVVSVLALVVPNYAVLVRRLHDSGRGAIWLCLVIPTILSSAMTVGTIVTAVGSVGLGASRETFVAMVLTGLGTAGAVGMAGTVCQLFLFILTTLPGTPGENRFGPDPRDPSLRYREDTGGFPYDEARLDALFAEARRESGAAEAPYRPVFDFGPGPAQSAASPAPHPPVNRGPVPHSGITPAPTFGRRRG